MTGPGIGQTVGTLSLLQLLVLPHLLARETALLRQYVMIVVHVFIL